jgi:hypothetical protein
VSEYALIAVATEVAKDPRVLRQIDWLTTAGWTVETLGEGGAPAGSARHWQLLPRRRWASGKWGRALMHAVLPDRAKFSVMINQRVPAGLRDALRQRRYGLIVLNDIDFAPWVADPGYAGHPAVHTHLDVHEFFPPHLPPGSRLRIRVDSHHVWLRSFIPHPGFASRTTVAGAIADAYAAEFGIPRPGIVRNAPDRVDLEPSPVEPGKVRLVHHGVAQWKRGLREMIQAVAGARRGVSLDLMLTGAPAVIEEVRALAAAAGPQVRVVEPVAMGEVARAVNRYDLEVMFYPPLTDNLRFALPNKLFEAVQGRLGLVIGESPMMVEIAELFGNAAIVHGWEPADLRAVVDELDPERIAELKRGSHRAADVLNAEVEGAEFLRLLALGGVQHPREQAS